MHLLSKKKPRKGQWCLIYYPLLTDIFFAAALVKIWDQSYRPYEWETKAGSKLYTDGTAKWWPLKEAKRRLEV